MSWSELSMFESHDIVRERFQSHHGRELGAEKAAEITAFFTQGRSYFEAAASAAPLVAPLLQYYGVNAITRGVTLFLAANARAASLKPSHGLTIHDWQGTLSHGIDRVGDLQLIIDVSGTFPEFCRVTQNRSRVLAFRDDYTPEMIDIPGTESFTAPVRVSMIALLSRVPGLNELYEDVLSEPANVFPVSIKTFAQSRRTNLEIYGSDRFPPSEVELRSRVPELSKGECRDHVEDSVARRPAKLFILPPGAEGSLGALPPLRESHGVTWMVVPFEGGVNLSAASVLVVLSFSLGMLSRYFPQHWRSLLGGSRGDRLYPLLREGVAIIARSFAEEIAGQLAAT